MAHGDVTLIFFSYLNKEKAQKIGNLRKYKTLKRKGPTQHITFQFLEVIAVVASVVIL